LKCLAILGLHVASLAVGESRVARKDLGMDLGGSGVGLGIMGWWWWMRIWCWSRFRF